MSKKKQTKKHKFKYAGGSQATMAAAAPAGVGNEVVKAAGNGAAARVPSGRPAVAVAAGTRDFSYVGRDLRRIAVLAVSLVALELVLWYLFAHTGVGNAVYSFVNV